jgi:dTDP-4-dehydrorhamnose reductase
MDTKLCEIALGKEHEVYAVARARPKDSSLDINKAKRTLTIRQLEIREALERMKKEKE